MIHGESEEKNCDGLRRHADRRRRAYEFQQSKAFLKSDKLTLIQELQMHQIELEMQNEELRRAQQVVEESVAKYSDLYDFAPVGYVTVNREGLIIDHSHPPSQRM